MEAADGPARRPREVYVANDLHQSWTAEESCFKSRGNGTYKESTVKRTADEDLSFGEGNGGDENGFGGAEIFNNSFGAVENYEQPPST